MFERKEPIKWKIPALILTGVIALSGGIYIGVKTRVDDSDKNKAKVEQTTNTGDSKEVFGLNKDCEMWVKKKNEDGTNSTQSPIMIGTVPQELLSKTKAEIVAYLEDKYPERTIESMTKYEIVLAETISVDDISRANKYSIEDSEGDIVLYKYNSKGKREILESTSIPTNSLPKDVQDEITKGLVLDTEDEAYSILENFSS